MLAGFGPRFGLNETTALAQARTLGRGMGQGEDCGAVTGALLIPGLASQAGPGDEVRRQKGALKMAREFSRRFKGLQGSIICRELLGLNPGTTLGQTKARARGLFKVLCPRFVEAAARTLGELLEEKGEEIA